MPCIAFYNYSTITTINGIVREETTSQISDTMSQGNF